MITDAERRRLWEAIDRYIEARSWGPPSAPERQSARRDVERVVEDIGCRMVDAVVRAREEPTDAS